MSTNAQQLSQKTPPQPKAPERDNIPRDVKNEIENLRRLAQHIHDRLHKLAKK